MDIGFKIISCAKCMVVFAIPDAVDERLRASHETFLCPMGHPQSYTSKTDLDKAREELVKVRGEVERLKEQAKKRKVK